MSYLIAQGRLTCLPPALANPKTPLLLYLQETPIGGKLAEVLYLACWMKNEFSCGYGRQRWDPAVPCISFKFLQLAQIKECLTAAKL
jgi:hypothetical protein